MGDIFYDHNAGSAKSIEPGQPGSTEVNKPNMSKSCDELELKYMFKKCDSRRRLSSQCSQLTEKL